MPKKNKAKNKKAKLPFTPSERNKRDKNLMKSFGSIDMAAIGQTRRNVFGR